MVKTAFLLNNLEHATLELLFCRHALVSCSLSLVYSKCVKDVASEKTKSKN